MIYIPQGTSQRKIKKIIAHEVYKRNFLREMARINAYFNAKEKLQPHWDKQNVQFKTVLAKYAEAAYLAEKRGISS